MPHRLALALLLSASCLLGAVTPPDAIVVVAGDQHSAYDKLPQFVAHVDRIRAENPGVAMAVFIDGDAFEYGNGVARRTNGVIDFAVFEALAKRLPVVLNLGNHESDLFGLAEVVARLRAAGVTVISGNLRDRTTGEAFAPATTELKLGPHVLTIVGVGTDRLATFRVAVRPQLDLTNPVTWAAQQFPRLLGGAAVPVVLSHAGVHADRKLLALVPDGTLFAGAHDHLRFVHREGRTVYFHSGSWMDGFGLAELRKVGGRIEWTVVELPILATDPADPTLAALVHDTLAKAVTPEEAAVVGNIPRALSPTEAAKFAVEAARVAAGADIALVGGTTFGGGLPAGAVSRLAFDACVRFDGTLYTGEIDGVQLQRLLTHANQGPETPFAERTGENLVAAVAPGAITPARRYRLVTTDWIARNPKQYLGDSPPVLTEQKQLRLKDAILAALRPAAVGR